MKMTTLGITKEEIIYQFINTLNQGGCAQELYAEAIVEKAINEYKVLVEKGIIKEIAYVEPGKPTDDPHVRVCKPAGDINARMYDVAIHTCGLEDDEVKVWDLVKGKYVHPDELPSHWKYKEEMSNE